MKKSYRSNIISKILKETPLETRVKVTIQAHYLVENNCGFFMPLDENGDEIPEAVEAMDKALSKAEGLIKAVLDDIKEWKEDGCPQ